MRLLSRSCLIAAASALSLFAGASAMAAQVAVPSRLPATIHSTSLTRLSGSVHALATAANDRGAVPDSTPLDRLQLQLQPSAAQQADLTSLLADLSNPSSPNYHHWLTPEEFGKRFGPSDADVATLSAWLSAQGFTVTGLKPGGQVIEFSGNAGQFSAAFHASFHRYAMPARMGVTAGQLRTSVSSDPEIPTALTPLVRGFVSLNNFPLKPQSKVMGHASFDPATHASKPSWTVGSNGVSLVLAPGDFAVQYDLNPLYNAGTNGSGQTIAIVNESNINTHLVDLYRSLFSLPANPVQVIVDGQDPGINGINNPYGENGAAGEAYLDVELSGAVAPNAKIDLVIAGSTATQDGLTLAAERAVYSNLAPVISLSFGACELNQGSYNQFINALWQQAAAQGISVVVSTGDSGSAGCDDPNTEEYATGGAAVNGLASTPYNIAVGGTDFYYSSYPNGTSALSAQLKTYWNLTASNATPTVSIQGVIPEQPWNNSQFGLNAYTAFGAQTTYSDTNIVGGGGGKSSCGIPTVNGSGNVTACAPYPKPAWQTGTGVPADGARDLPDVSLFAANGNNFSYYPICGDDGDCQPVSSGGTVQITGIGGTSASTPAFGGMLALVNQLYGRQGQANTVLYPLAKQFPAAFHDITVGSNAEPCNLQTDSLGNPPNGCIASSPTYYGYDANGYAILEGVLGTGTTPSYNAGTGYDLATGLGTIDAYQMVKNWQGVSFASTTTTLTASATTFAHGTPVTLSGTVKSSGSTTPTGNVAIVSTAGQPSTQGLGAFALSNGSFSGSLSSLPGGTYTLTANFPGDTVNGPSTSSPTVLTVSPEASGTALLLYSPFGSQIAAGNSVPFGATYIVDAFASSAANVAGIEQCRTGSSKCPNVTPATGSVAFNDTTGVLATSAMNSQSEASYTWSATLGAHSISASYSGDASYAASTSAPTAFTVVKATPTLDGAIFTTPSSTGTPVLLYIVNPFDTTGKATPPTGTITISGIPGVTTATLSPSIDANQNGSAAGVATVTAPTVTQSTTYTVTVSYPGDSNYNPLTATIKLIEGPVTGTLASSTSVLLNQTTTTPGKALVAAVTVTGSSTKGGPTGSVGAYSGTTFAGQCNLTAGATVSVCSIGLDSSALQPGNNTVIFSYSGDTNYQVSNATATITNAIGDFSMTPATASIGVTAGSSTAITDTLTLASNSYAGTVNLTCAATNGVTCSVSPASATLSANGSATSVVSLNVSGLTGTSNSAVTIVGTDSTGQRSHTATIRLVQATPGDFTLTAASTNLIVSPNSTSITESISVAATGAFSGAVNLTCTATGGVTCSLVPPAVTLTQGGTASSTLTIGTTGFNTTGGTVTVTGTDSTGARVHSVAIQLVPSAYFTLSNGGTITLASQGSTGSTSITVNPVGGFSGAVNLTCVVTASPTGASSIPTCVVAPTSTATSATLTINTTAPTYSMLTRGQTEWLAAGGTLAAILLIGFGAGSRRRRRWTGITLAVVSIVALTTVAGCGSGSNSTSGGTPHGGTTLGSYTVTVAGTDAATGKLNAITAVSVVVN